jgi:F-type H+-transporting ATPase subunit delta
MESVIAEKYALALFEAARDKKNVAEMGRELKGLMQILTASPELTRLLTHPRLTSKEKLTALEAVLPQKPSELLGRFLALLLDKKRGAEIAAVTECFEKFQYAAEGKAPVRVLTATPLTPAQKEALVQKVAATFQVKPEIREEVQPELLGGMVLILGDRRLDASVLGQLERLKQSLLS